MTTATASESTAPLLFTDNFASDQVRFGVDWLQALAGSWGLSEAIAEIVATAIGVGIVIVICVLANLAGKLFICAIVNRWLQRRQSEWGKALATHKVFGRLSQLVPVALLAIAMPAFVQYGVDWWLRPLLEVYITFVILLMAFGLLEVAEVVAIERGMKDRIPITGISQAVKVILTFFAVMLALSVLVAESPLMLLSGLGAVAAVLMLIFKDPILGLVAGIQVTANNMVKVGDWIQMDSNGVDGTVEEITMTTIRVMGFDRTVSLVPAYDLISKPFINWEAMTDSGGRRIKRSINIDLGTIRYVSRDDLVRFRKFAVLNTYLDERIAEIDTWNTQRAVDTSETINGRQLTNVGIFRAYVEAYLRQHSKVHQEGFTFLVRHLQPTQDGLPIQIYCFANDNRWPQYEAIQADIFDHMLAAVPEFDLAVFQSPSGRNLQQLIDNQ
jgi:miniconductance mechanosensitive channel